MMRTATRIETGTRGEDRPIVVQAGERTIIVVADGAGGTGRGADAAQMVCDLALASFRRGAMLADAWMARLSEIDAELFRSGKGGQSTAVVVEVDGDTLRGAIVGDSAAWAIDSLGFVDLTDHQNRKPLLGTGDAVPVAIGPTPLPERLLVATDGLLNYCPEADIDRIALGGTLEEAIDELVSRVRLRSGGFQDDLAIVLCDGEQPGR
jgi:serine/threonine protein phosphatase PrpC